MTFKVQVGPPQIAIHQAMTVLVTETDGHISWPSDKGLYFFDTRLISAWAVYANGAEWDLLSGGAVNFDTARIFLTNQAFLTEDGPIQAHTLAFELSRVLAQGMHEDLDITNHGQKPVRFNLEIALRSDFADVFDVKSSRSIRRGRITTDWSESRQTLRTTYQNADFDRVSRCFGCRGRVARGVRQWPAELRGEACRLARPGIAACCTNSADGAQTLSRAAWLRRSIPSGRRRPQAHRDWRQTVLKIRTGNEEFYRFYHQAIDDMAALRLPIDGHRPHGVPARRRAALVHGAVRPRQPDRFVAEHPDLPGVCPRRAGGAGRAGRPPNATITAMPNRARSCTSCRYGELAHFKLIPHTPYYGTADATPLYLITLHAAWRATGDQSLLETHLPNAEAALDWIDNYGDRDGDGFQEYQTRSPVGYENMAWKDAGDSMIYADGSPVKGPKALCELQGYVYDAWLRMAEIFDALGQAGPGGEAAAEGGDAVPEVQRGVLGRGQPVLCVYAGWRETEGHDRGLQPRASAVVRASCRPIARRGSLRG